MKTLAYALIFVGAAGDLKATQITGSSALSTTNSTTGATEAFTSAQINTTWTANVFAGSPSTWISFDSANLFGCSATQTQTVDKTATFCGGVTAGTIVTFTDTFSISGTPSGIYTLYVLADDSATVSVNGTQIIAAGTGSSGPCSNTVGAVNCITVDTFNVSSDLHTGSNTLTFAVHQNLNNSEFGLNFDLVSSVPEPATFGLAGIALLAIGLQRLRKNRR